jgi:hypothetical protein
MLNLEDAIKNAVERICRDRNEDDKIYIHVSDLAGEAIRQHAKILHDMRRANEEAQELAKAKAEGRLVELPCKVGDIVYADCYGDIIGWEVHQIEMRTGKPTQYIARGDDEGYGVPEIDFTGEDIGKTVFLTREEAEKALQGRLAYDVCHYCFGKGSLEGEGYAECPYCDGTGFEPVDDMMDDMMDDEIELLEAGE